MEPGGGLLTASPLYSHVVANKNRKQASWLKYTQSHEYFINYVVRESDLEQLMKCLDGKTEYEILQWLTRKDDDGNTALHKAVKSNQHTIEMLDFMLGKLRDEEAVQQLLQTDSSGANCVSLAIRSNRDVSFVGYLLSKLPNYDCKVHAILSVDNIGYNCFHRAITGWSTPQMLGCLLTNLPECSLPYVIAHQNPHGYSLIHSALYYRCSTDALSCLVLKLSDKLKVQVLLAKNEDGESCLHIAKQQEQLGYILDKIPKELRPGAIMTKNAKGRNCIHNLLSGGYSFPGLEVVDLLLVQLTSEQQVMAIVDKDRYGNNCITSAAGNNGANQMYVIKHLLNYLPPEFQSRVICARNQLGLNAIQTVLKSGRVEEMGYLLNKLPVKEREAELKLLLG